MPDYDHLMQGVRENLPEVDDIDDADLRERVVAAWAMAAGAGTGAMGGDEAGTVSTDVSMAKSAASDAVDLACRAALQCHGAIGYTIEHDLQLWLKRGWALAASWGDAAHHRRRVAGSLGLLA